MRGFSAEHWVLIAGFMATIAVQLMTMGDSWEHATTPAFIGGVLSQLAILIRAFFSDKPTRGNSPD